MTTAQSTENISSDKKKRKNDGTAQATHTHSYSRNETFHYRNAMHSRIFIGSLHVNYLFFLHFFLASSLVRSPYSAFIMRYREPRRLFIFIVLVIIAYASFRRLHSSSRHHTNAYACIIFCRNYFVDRESRTRWRAHKIALDFELWFIVSRSWSPATVFCGENHVSAVYSLLLLLSKTAHSPHTSFNEMNRSCILFSLRFPFVYLRFRSFASYSYSSHCGSHTFYWMHAKNQNRVKRVCTVFVHILCCNNTIHHWTHTHTKWNENRRLEERE